MYVLAAVAVGIFGYGIWRRLRVWRQGRPVARLTPVWPRLLLVLRHVAAHGRLLADRVAGLYHFAFFWGFVFLFAGTVVVFIHQDFGLRIMQGRFYLYFQSAALDAMGLAAIAGVGAALWQRYVAKNPRLRRGIWSDAAILVLFELILVTGYLVEGLRIAATHDPWAPWSFAGLAVARGAWALGLGEATLRAWHAGLWWLHFALAMAFIAYVPYSKLFHLVLAPANVYLQPLQAPASPAPIDFEKTERLGASAPSDLRWKDLFDLDVCTECGRCTAVCPASMTGKPLSPMDLILDLRNELRDGPGDGAAPRKLAGEVVRPETLWACTTCMACMEACPVFIEHVPKIVEMRRYLVMEESEFPETMQDALRSLEARGHPFRGATASRTGWYQGLGVVELTEPGQAASVDVVYWAGCAAAFDERNQKVARAFVTSLLRAGVRVGVLGAQEQCTGDPARRIGNEFLFEQLARANIETFERLGVRRIVTTCPHCFNTFNNEYPAFGGRYQVTHHTEMLAKLAAEGRLKARPSKAREQRVTFHDPCYLGRHNGVVEPPRFVLEELGGAELVEMPRNRTKSLCCGAGGGRMWVEEPEGQRVSRLRAGEAVATGAETVAVGCPFCMAMLDDAVKAAAGEREVQVRDVAELVEEATRWMETAGAGTGSAAAAAPHGGQVVKEHDAGQS
ncbi:MAG: 4Fe-4S dicluster domain-containing protein [Limnochordaceae bacterium]|nr:4Fe-4S dicluster domain-containing protein [Limnochordaceae bacterium]